MIQRREFLLGSVGSGFAVLAGDSTIEVGMKLINPEFHPGELRLLYVGS